jgi:putative phosphoribosyl transferase
MKPTFRDRRQAGELLAETLVSFAGDPTVLVLGLPRGGMPVAAEVARALQAPLDVFVVRKLGVPGCEELAMGAIASGGVRLLNEEVVTTLHVPSEVIESVADAEQRELERRASSYRRGLPPLVIADKTVIIVDDGIATGSTAMAAIKALRQMAAARIFVATPVIAASTYGKLRALADEVFAVLVPEDFRGVGEWYSDFSQTSDEEVQQILALREHHDSDAAPGREQN